MKRCPECRRDYTDETLNFCLDDGTPLVDGPAVSDPDARLADSRSNENVTAILDSPSTGSRSYPEMATRHFQSAGPSSETGRPGRRFPFVAAAVIGAAVLTGLGYAIYSSIWRPQGTGPARASKPINIQRLTGDGKTRDAEISPDGKFLVYKRVEKDTESLFIRQIQTGSVVEVAKPGELTGITQLVFSPDGNFIYFAADDATGGPGGIYRVPTLGGVPTKVLSNAAGVQFSPDGKQVSFGRMEAETETAIYIANADGSNERKLSSRKGKQFFDLPAAWSPDGKLLAVGAGDDDLLPNPDDAIIIISVDDGRVREFGSRRWAGIGDIVWHPTGDSLIIIASESEFVPGQVWEVSYPSGESRRLTNNLNGYEQISITHDGNSIVTMERYSRSAVWVSPDLDPKNARPIMPSNGDTWGFSWTWDKRIVYVSDQSGDAEVWIMNPDGSAARQLTNDRVFKSVPVASPDGRYVVYFSAAAPGKIIRIDANGGNPVSLTSVIGADNPDVSPDGKWVIHSGWLEGIQYIFRVQLEGGEPQKITDFRSTEPRYSPDGTSFACFAFSDAAQRFNKIAVVPSEGGQPDRLLDAPAGTNISRGVVWAPDGKGIVVIATRGERLNLWLVPVDGSAPKQMTDFDVPVVARREYSRDGKQIALVRAEGVGNAIMITDFR